MIPQRNIFTPVEEGEELDRVDIKQLQCLHKLDVDGDNKGQEEQFAVVLMKITVTR